MRNPNRIGAVTEAAIASEATKHGFEVYVPLSGHSRCDLIFEREQKLFRVQCKTARRSGEVLVIKLVSSWHTPNGYVRHRYDEGELDLVAAYCPDLDLCYLIPWRSQ